MKTTRTFLFGFVFATAIFVCYSAKADGEPKIVGENGYLSGVAVVDKRETLCIGPYYDKTEKTLTCKY